MVRLDLLTSLFRAGHLLLLIQLILEQGRVISNLDGCLVADDSLDCILGLLGVVQRIHLLDIKNLATILGYHRLSRFLRRKLSRILLLGLFDALVGAVERGLELLLDTFGVLGAVHRRLEAQLAW